MLLFRKLTYLTVAQALWSHRLLCTRIYFTKQKVSKVAVQKDDLPFCSSSLKISQADVLFFCTAVTSSVLKVSRTVEQQNIFLFRIKKGLWGCNSKADDQAKCRPKDLTNCCAILLKPEAYDMIGRSQMQGGKNWILPKDINANRFFWDSHWLEIWKNTFVPLWDRMEGAWLWTQRAKGRFEAEKLQLMGSR